jgi:hypothetical protein
VQTSTHPDAAGQPAQAQRTRAINAEHLKLALVARKLRPGTRWAAVSNGMATQACKPQRYSQGWGIHTQPLLAPMDRGYMQSLLERVRRQHGRAEVQRTWGAGMRALGMEFAACVLGARQ